MADQLGEAKLILSVDDSALKKGLQDAKKLIESELKGATAKVTPRTQNSNAGSTSNSRRETKTERDLEVLKEKRFRLARRIDSLEERGVSTTRLRTQLGRLTTAYADREFTAARRISQELARQVSLSEVKDRSARRAAREAKAQADANVKSARGLGRTNIEGSQRDVGSPVFSARGVSRGGARESITAITDAQQRRYKLDQQIRSLEANGVRTTKLRTQLGEATTAQARRQFGSFNQIADSLEFTLRKERDRLRVARDQSREIERQVTAGQRVGRLNASPVRGGIAFPGSPGALAAKQAEGLRIGRLNTSPVQGGTGFPGSPAAIRAEQRLAAARERSAKAADKSIEIEGRRIGRLNTSPVTGRTPTGTIPGSPAFLADELKRNTKAYENFTRTQRQEGIRIGSLNSSPVTGRTPTGTIPGSPAAIADAEKKLAKARRDAAAEALKTAKAEQRLKDDRNRRIKDAAGGAIIGGAFPALFGQGLGASVGGALGGGGGGALGGQFGFGLSLVGTAVGDQFDQATEKFKLLGEAAKDPITNFSALADAGLLSSKSVEKLAQGFIDTGDTASAAAIIQQDLANSYGDGSAAKALAEANRELNRSYTELQVAIASLAAGGITAVVDETTKSLNGFTAALKFLKDNLPQLPEGAGDAVKGAATNAVLLTAFPSVGSAALAGKTLNDIFAPNKAKSEAIEKQKQLDLENKITAAAARTTKERSTQFQLTNAQVQGNRTALLDAQKQSAIDERKKG